MFWRKHKKNAQDMAWLVRASFEIGWRAAGGDPAKWRDPWKSSPPRATLVAMGYIKEEDGFR